MRLSIPLWILSYAFCSLLIRQQMFSSLRSIPVLYSKKVCQPLSLSSRVKVPKLDHLKILHMLRLFESNFLAPLERKVVAILWNVSGFLNMIKRILLVVSWLKLVSYMLDTFEATQAKLKDVADIASSLYFVGSTVTDKVHWAAENGHEILRYMYMTIMLFFLSTGMHFFAFLVVALGIYQHSGKAKLDNALASDN